MTLDAALIAGIVGAFVSFITTASGAVIAFRRETSKINIKNNESKSAIDQKMEELRLRQDQSERETMLQKALIEQIGDIKALRDVQDELKKAVIRVGDEVGFHAETVKQNTKITENLRISVDKNTEETTKSGNISENVGEYIKGVWGGINTVKDQMQATGRMVMESGNKVAANSDARAGELKQMLNEINDKLDRIEAAQERLERRVKHIEETMIIPAITNTINVPPAPPVTSEPNPKSATLSIAPPDPKPNEAQPAPIIEVKPTSEENKPSGHLNVS